MACAEYSKGSSFHGVLHSCSESDMKILDAIEGEYKRI